MDIEVRTLDAFDLDALSVYARLRRYAPERGSYLLESRAHKSPEGRYSVVGYRVRTRDLMPPGVDAWQYQATNIEREPAPESFAAALALAAVGYVSPSCVNVRQKLPLFRDEGPAAQFMVGATVVVFDHQERTVTVAGPRQGNLVERCLWEIENGSDALTDLPTSDGAPGEMQAMISDEALTGRGTRAKPYFGEELTSLVMAQCYFVPLGKVDPFDIYRVLRGAPDVVHGYYVDFGAVMHGPDTRIAGIAGDTVHQRRRSETSSRSV
ncbi:MAG TPA: hypothetical protein VFB62_10290, partial [Polyangiaceae bacterium]|nr:hypothetical protein [Polyangiaceae bacterium]